MRKIIKLIIDMLYNNGELGAYSVGEDLTNWLELGFEKFEDMNDIDIEFAYENNNLTKEELQLVYEINPYVKQLTQKLAEMYERERK